MARRQGKHGQMLQLIQQAKTERLFTAEELLQISHLCREVPFAHIPAAKAALSAALQCMRSQKDTPSMDMLAEVSLCDESHEIKLFCQILISFAPCAFICACGEVQSEHPAGTAQDCICHASASKLTDLNAAVQTVRQLYELSSEDEVLALLADISVYLRTLGSPAYPRRHVLLTLTQHA